MASYPVRIEDDARFVRAIGWVFLALTFGAFVQSYFVPLARASFVSANLWMHPHAIVSFAFAALFIAQPSLVLAKNWRWHRIVGWTLAALVVGAVVTGAAVQLAMWPTVPEDANNLTPAAFRMFQLLPTLAIFFAAAVLLRRRPDWHWRLMIHAALAPIGTALVRFARMIPDPPLPPGPLVTLSVLLVIIGLLVSDRGRYGRFHPANWIALAAHVATTALSLAIAGSQWYERIALG